MIVRDPDSGEATGMLGGSAMKLVTGAIPEATLEELQAAVLLAISMAHAFGITSAIDPGWTMSRPSPFESWQRRLA